MTEPPVPSVATVESPRDPMEARLFGHYKILQKLGEGGFGAVFEAEQAEPVRRLVALKVIKLGMDTREVIARFEAERQALALMDHPHIARVLDAGASADGRPYFVMELVKGEPISSYCDRHRLSIVERLELFEQVCQAVQHAHTKGVIHRDLKPSNILVSEQDDKAFAKVIDFGIAKAVSGRLTDKTLFTEQFQMIGTPLYMSPEQAEGSLDIDTRTDIYSLGVLLYELLTGTTPFESSALRAAAHSEVQRIIREVDPPRPSARLAESDLTLSGAAARCRSEPGKLRRVVRGELDWIVMKAIEKDRARRYETANGLAMDVHRFLAGERVLAAPPSVSYRVRKFVRRNRIVVAAASLVALSLIAGIAGFAWQARVASRRAAELEQVSRFQAEMLGQVNPTAAGRMLTEDVRRRLPDDPAIHDHFEAAWSKVNATDAARALIDRTILEPAVTAIDRQFGDQPLVDATLRQVLARRYREMGLNDKAMPLQQRALEIRRERLGSLHPDTLTSINEMGQVYWAQGKLDEADTFIRESLEGRKKVLGETHGDTAENLNDLGVMLLTRGKGTEAEPMLRRSIELLRRARGDDYPRTIEAISNLGYALRAQGRLPEAESLYREALERRRRVLGADNSETLISLNNLGAVLRAEGKLDEAEPFLREAVEAQRRVAGEEHPDTLRMINNYGVLLKEQGKLEQAEPYFREALEKSRRVLGPTHQFTLTAQVNFGGLRTRQGRFAEALEILNPIEAEARKAFTGANSVWLAALLVSLGRAHAGLHENAIAEKQLVEAREIYLKTRGAEHPETRDAERALAELRAATSRG